jgi:UDP-N-acetylglucosamine 4,6-dehydratase
LNILITGCGFFTNHFVARLLAEEEYERICIYSRDEFKHAKLRERFDNDKRLRFFIGDVRDKDRLRHAMQGGPHFQRMNHVVHGAALKRIETANYNPGELAKTNVIGTANVVDCCQECGVQKAVLLSTDKAFEPISAYGQSKALAESLFLAANGTGGPCSTRFMVTRYGNVAGSTGSVIPTWRSAEADGKTIRIVRDEVTRFWMNARQAVELVLLALNEDLPTDLVIPTLRAFTLRDLRNAMFPRPISWQQIDLPSYEKPHESLQVGQCSKDAERMSVDDLRRELANV